MLEADGLAESRARLARGGSLVQQGHSFAGPLLVRSWSCKSSIVAPAGQEQIIAYHIAGEILGAGAIDAQTHDASTTALEDSEFWIVPLARIMAAARNSHCFTIS